MLFLKKKKNPEKTTTKKHTKTNHKQNNPKAAYFDFLYTSATNS